MDATLLDPEIADSLHALGINPGNETTTALPDAELLALLRSQPAQYNPRPAAGVSRRDITIPGGAASLDVEIRVFELTERKAAAVPGLIWFHGGGYVIGSYDMDADKLDGLVLATGCVALSVNYRLAPEAPYPGPFEDGAVVLRFLSSQGRDLGVDPARIIVAGSSAGAGLAAAVALFARDQGIRLVHQHLIYPMIDDRRAAPSSRWPDPVWSAEMNTLGWRSYLADMFGRDDVPAYAAPARAADLRGSAPAYIHVRGRDGFLREDIAYATRLLASDVPVELHVLPGAPHAFDVLAADAEISRTALSLSDAALRRALNR